jgi:hypothetical protein
MASAKKKKAAAKKPHGTGAQKNAASRGIKKLKTAADKKLSENSEKIADSLFDQLIKGKVTSGKLLIALAEEPSECENEAELEQPRSIAEELASDSEWDGEPDEEEAEADLEERERESSRSGSKNVAAS